VPVRDGLEVKRAGCSVYSDGGGRARGTYTPRISVQVGRGWELGDAGEDIGRVLEQRSETTDVGVVGGAGGTAGFESGDRERGEG